MYSSETINQQLQEIKARHYSIQLFIEKTKDKIDVFKRQPEDKELYDFASALLLIQNDQIGDQLLAKQLADNTQYYLLQSEQLLASLDALSVLKNSQSSPRRLNMDQGAGARTPSQIMEDSLPQLSSLNHQQQLFTFIQKLKEIEDIQNSKIDIATAAQQTHLQQLQLKEIDREQRINDLEQQLYEARKQIEIHQMETEMRANQIANQTIQQLNDEIKELKAALAEEHEFNQQQVLEVEVIQKELLSEVERLIRENTELKKHK